MSQLVIKNLSREFRSLEIDFKNYEKDRAERFVENLKEFVSDERLSNEIIKSDELSNVLNLISNKL